MEKVYLFIYLDVYFFSISDLVNASTSTNSNLCSPAAVDTITIVSVSQSAAAIRKSSNLTRACAEALRLINGYQDH
jgi:hypothetical protein